MAVMKRDDARHADLVRPRRRGASALAYDGMTTITSVLPLTCTTVIFITIIVLESVGDGGAHGGGSKDDKWRALG